MWSGRCPGPAAAAHRLVLLDRRRSPYRWECSGYGAPADVGPHLARSRLRWRPATAGGQSASTEAHGVSVEATAGGHDRPAASPRRANGAAPRNQPWRFHGGSLPSWRQFTWSPAPPGTHCCSGRPAPLKLRRTARSGAVCAPATRLNLLARFAPCLRPAPAGGERPHYALVRRWVKRAVPPSSRYK